ncbi:MAG: Fe-S-containing protein [Treponema sp.]|jgi:uncharacterized membrane protein|nr:Fe-S-containing protein [Treponema sp.]
MIRYFLQVLQASLGALLLAAMLLALDLKTRAASAVSGRKDGKKERGAAPFCLAGIAAALAPAFLRRATAVNMGKISTFTAALLCAAGLVFIAAALTRRPAAPRSAGYGAAVFTGRVLLFLLPFYALPAVFFYPTEFLLAGESAFSTDFLFKCAGFLAGLCLSLLAAFTLYRTGRSLGRALVFILCPALFINIIQLLCAVLQFLFARRVIPMNRTLFRLITPALNNGIIFLFLILAVCAAAPVLAFVRTFHRSGTWRNPAERRKARALLRRKRRLAVTLALSFAFAFCSLTVLKAFTERDVELSPAESYTLSGNEIIIPLEKIEDGHLHRFNYSASDSIGMRFIIIKKNESAYGVGLDACDICGPTGYYERKDGVICRLCDVVMNRATIGFRGGCNPVPLAYTMRSGNMVIQTEKLEAERSRFK